MAADRPRGPVAPELVLGEIHPIVVEAIDDDGYGVGTREGCAVHVAGVAPGDDVSVRIDSVSQHRPDAWATVVEVHSRGPGWQRPGCRNQDGTGGRCGGCGLLHLTKDAQRDAKQNATVRALAGLGVAELPWNGAADLGYRNRSNHAVFASPTGARLGSFARRSHQPAWMDGCVVVHPAIERARDRIEEVVRALDIPLHMDGQHDAFRRDHAGGLRWVSLRASRHGAVLAELISSGAFGPIDALGHALVEQGVCVGAWASRNAEPGNAIRTEAARHLAGAERVEEQVGPLSVPLGPRTFFQLNTAVAAQMYARAAEWLGPARSIVDLYCGVGGIGLTAALGTGARVTGWELGEESIAIARALATHHGVEAEFEVADLEPGLPSPIARDAAVVVNPPRRGLTMRLLEDIAESDSSALVYMSCSPVTFARDAEHLVRRGWRLTHLEAWDMLPHTTHVELLARLERGTRHHGRGVRG